MMPMGIENSGKFVWPRDAGATVTLSRAQFEAPVLGLPWQRIGEAGVIRLNTTRRRRSRQFQAIQAHIGRPPMRQSGFPQAV
jgi:hypothetical protein